MTKPLPEGYHKSRPGPTIQLQLQIQNAQGEVVVEVGPEEYPTQKDCSICRDYTVCPQAAYNNVIVP